MTLPPIRTFEAVRIGDLLPELEIPLTRTLIVATAIAGRDFQDVHHDPELAVERGCPDVFMNILTTNGLLDRFATSWAGPASVVKALRIRLGAPNHPGDTMVMTGEVTGKDVENRSVSISVTGENSRGTHVTGTVDIHLPGAEEESA